MATSLRILWTSKPYLLWLSIGCPQTRAGETLSYQDVSEAMHTRIPFFVFSNEN